jgi:excisionase family DNA binding protein
MLSSEAAHGVRGARLRMRAHRRGRTGQRADIAPQIRPAATTREAVAREGHQGLLVTKHEAEQSLHRATPSASYSRGYAGVREASASPHWSHIRGVRHATGEPSAVDCPGVAPRYSSYRALPARMAGRAIATEHPMCSPPPDGMREERQPELLTVTQAAHLAAVSRYTVSGWITNGKLPAVRIEGRRFIHPADLAATQARAHVGDVVPAWRQHRQRAGKRLRALREAAGLSQLQLAAASGLTHEAISNLETGKRAPLAATVVTLAQALAVEPERFVSREPGRLTTLTVAGAAARLDVPVGRVQRWLKEGELVGTKVSGQWRVPAVVVAELARSGRLRGQSRRLDPRYRG